MAVLIPDLTWMQDTALSVAALAAVLGLANVLLGLFSVITGKDHFPKGVRLWRLYARVPASTEDFRTHGMGLMLNGTAVVLMELGLTANIAGAHGLRGFPGDALFLITGLAFLTSLACLAGSFSLGVRTRYVSTRASTDARSGAPPA